MAESKNSLINQVLDSFARDLGFTDRLSQMGGNLKNTFKTMRSTLNDMSLDGVRKFANENIHGGKGVSSAAAAERKVKKVFKDYAPLSKKELPKGRGGTEALFSLGRSKYKPKSKSSQEARERKNVRGTPTTKLTEIVVRPKPSVKDVAPLGGSSYEIKKGDTLSAIAKRKNTTVAALMRMNPKIKDKDKIRAGQFIKVGKPKTETFRIKEKKRSGTTDPARTIAEAKRRGLTTYTPKGSNTPKAAVTAAELKKSGLSLRAYLNKMKKKKKKK